MEYMWKMWSLSFTAPCSLPQGQVCLYWKQQCILFVDFYFMTFLFISSSLIKWYGKKKIHLKVILELCTKACVLLTGRFLYVKCHIFKQTNPPQTWISLWSSAKWWQGRSGYGERVVTQARELCATAAWVSPELNTALGCLIHDPG